MNRMLENTIRSAKDEANGANFMLSLLAGGLHGLVIGMQIGFLMVQGVIPAGWLGVFPTGELVFQTFVMSVGALVGAIVVVAALLINEQGTQRRR